MPYGTGTVLDTLAASFQTIAEYDPAKAFEQIRQYLDIHNRLLQEQQAAFVAPIAERQIMSGSYAAMSMMELGEWGTPDAQKIMAGALLGFPLRRYGGAIQWTGIAMKVMTGEQMAAQAIAMADADRLNQVTQMRKAIYRPVNYTWNDRFIDVLQNIPLGVKALANADGFPIPPGPNGEQFNAATHTHYLPATTAGTLAAGDFDALLQTVREHQSTGTGMVGINAVDAATVSAFPKFRPLTDDRIIQPLSATYVNPNYARLNLVNTNNRMIGVYDGYDVWVKPWIYPLYPVAWWDSPSMVKPLALRTDPRFPSGLTLTFDGEVHDLKADVYERFYGYGVRNRIGMAVLDAAHTTYTSPI